MAEKKPEINCPFNAGELCDPNKCPNYEEYLSQAIDAASGNTMTTVTGLSKAARTNPMYPIHSKAMRIIDIARLKFCSLNPIH